MDYTAIQTEIRSLAGEKKAIILAHNYQRPEVQDVADILGDSLGLSRQAAAADASLIVFCGVHFMAETAAILAPDRQVIIPEPRAGCPMADMVDVEGLEALKREHPGAIVVSYVNTSAAVKAASDICCTSANAVRVLQTIPVNAEIIFVPDCNLGAWAAKKAGRELVLWPGFCPTHDLIEVEDVWRARALHPGAKVVVHPECKPEVAEIADAVESTSGMIRFCQEEDAHEFLIGTEMGMVYRLSQVIPDKRFYPVSDVAVCPNMKLTTLDKVLRALRNEYPVVTVDPDIRERALRAVQRMVEVLP
jgi:quinolinate synthase